MILLNISSINIFFYQHIFIIFQLESEEKYRMSKPLEPKNIPYNIIKKLGQGAFGVVYEALDYQNNKVAIKEIKMIKLNQCEKVKQLFKTQIAVLKGCKNENVIKFVDYFQIDNLIYLVTQFCNGGDLQSYLKRQTVLEDQAVEFLIQILNGFKGLHQVGAMHRDFKAENVLIHDGVCKIADLGFAKQMQQNQIAKTILGTTVTMAPQVLDGTAYGFQADIWSIGVVFYQMLYKKYPYVAKNDFELKKNIKYSKPQYKDINISNQARDFLEKCLTVNPKNRINWKQIYDHPLITKNQGRILKSRLKVKQNKQSYENVKFPISDKFQQKITQDRIVKIKILGKENVRISNISETLKREQQIKRQQQEAIQRFDRLFLKKRNDLMFFQKFVYPYISNLQYVYINHAVLSFVLSKKACIQVKQLQESIQKLDNPFIKQKGFDIYCKSENFQNMKILLQQDFQRIYKICDTEKKRIKITEQISQEIIYQFTDLTKSKTNRSYNSFTQKIIRQYFFLLKYDLVKNQSRTDFIRVSEAIKYYNDTQQPRTHQFNLYIMKADFAQLEKKYFPKHTFI